MSRERNWSFRMMNDLDDFEAYLLCLNQAGFRQPIMKRGEEWQGLRKKYDPDRFLRRRPLKKGVEIFFPATEGVTLPDECARDISLPAGRPVMIYCQFKIILTGHGIELYERGTKRVQLNSAIDYPAEFSWLILPQAIKK